MWFDGNLSRGPAIVFGFTAPLMWSSEQDRWTIAEVGVHNQYDSWHIWILTRFYTRWLFTFTSKVAYVNDCFHFVSLPRETSNGKSLQASFWPLAQANLCPPAALSTVFDLSSSCASCRSLWTPLTLPRRGRLNISQVDRMYKCYDMDEDGERCMVYIIYAYVHVYYDALF